MNGKEQRAQVETNGVRGRFGMAASVLAVAVLLAACNDKPAGSQPAAGASPPAAPSPAPAPAPVQAPVAAAPTAAATAVEAASAPQTLAAPRKLPLNVQGVAAAGVTVRVKGIEIGTDATVLDVSISFANRITSSTMLAMLDTYLEDESGSRLQIKRPTNNRDLIIREGEMLNGQLVFMGAVPASARKLRLVFNESNTDDNIVAPGFSVDLPLSGG